jgi:hypothetical protein
MKSDMQKAYEAMTAPRSIRWFLSALKDEIAFGIRKHLNWRW